MIFPNFLDDATLRYNQIFAVVQLGREDSEIGLEEFIEISLVF